MSAALSRTQGWRNRQRWAGHSCPATQARQPRSQPTAPGQPARQHCCTVRRPGERGAITHRELEGADMHTPTLFPKARLDPRIVVATVDPTPRDTRVLDSAHDDTVLFARPRMRRVTLREVAPPTGEFVQYLFTEWCDEEITDWAREHLKDIAQLRAEAYVDAADALDRADLYERAHNRAMGRGTTVRSELVQMLHAETKNAACATIYAAVARRART